MKKIAIATDSGMVAQHFGRCPTYTICDLENEKIINKSEIPNPGHSTGFIPKYLHEQNVNVIISGGMGRRAIDLFYQFKIEPIVGITGTIDNCLKNILNGSLKGGESLCSPGGGKGYGIAKEDEGHFDHHHHNE